MNKDKTELEEDIKNLSEIIQLCEDDIKKNNNNVTATLDLEDLKSLQTVLEALEKLQKDNYKLDRENQKLFEENINSIPKKKIENEIEILKAQCGGNIFHIQQTLNAEIRLLQELLEDK